MAIEVKGKVSLDGKGWEAGLRQVAHSTDQFAGGLGALKNKIAGAFTIGAVTSFVKEVIQNINRIKDAAEQLDVGTDLAQGLEFVFKRNNASIDDAIKAFDKLESARQAALADPSGKAGKAFQSFGISPQDLVNDTRAELFAKISRHMQTAQRSGVELVNLMDLFGEKLASKLRMSLVDGLDNAIQKAREAKAIIDSANIKRIDRGTKQIEQGKAQVVAASGNILGDILEKPIANSVKYALVNALAGGGLAGLGMLQKVAMMPRPTDQNASAAEKSANEAAILANKKMQADVLADIVAKNEKKVLELDQMGLTNEEKILRLQKEREKIVDKMNKAQTPIERETIRGELIQNDIQTKALQLDSDKQKEKKLPVDKDGPADIPHDQLLSVGNFLGASGRNTMDSVAKSQLAEAKTQTEVHRQAVQILGKILLKVGGVGVMESGFGGFSDNSP